LCIKNIIGNAQDHACPIFFSQHSCCDQGAITDLLSDQHYRPELPDGYPAGRTGFGFRARCKNIILYIPITILHHTTSTTSVFTSPTLKPICYFNPPAVDRDASQSKGLEFGYIKGRLPGASFEESDQLLQEIDAIFQSIEEATLEHVFQQ
jgi:hypothetical protein